MIKPEKAFRKSLYATSGMELDAKLGAGSFSEGIFSLRKKSKTREKLRNRMSKELEHGEEADRSLAVKICKTEDSRLLRDEHALLLSIDHPHIINVYYYPIITEKHCGMIMERVVGRDLLDMLDDYYHSFNTYPRRKTVQWVLKPILLALNYLHQNGIIHNDIKPENILVGTRSLDQVDCNTPVKLCDFGLATKFSSKNSNAGSPDWASPEKFFRELGKPSHASDMCSFGFVSYALVCGRMPIYIYSDPTPGKKFSKENYEEMHSKLQHDIQCAKKGFYAKYPEFKNITLSTIPLDPKQRFSAQLVLQFDFFEPDTSITVSGIKHSTSEPIETLALAAIL